jgi:hypothetical protein
MIRVRWWHWTALAVLIAAYALAGLLFSKHINGNLLYNIGALGTCITAILFVTIYTVMGLRGPAKWWRNLTGTSIVIAVASLIASYGEIAWAVVFHKGLVDTPAEAWILIGGTYLSFIGVLGLSWLWLGYRHTHFDEKPPSG